ncbi:MAG TPA: zf-HC2 domain-containing protein [Gemmatimonadales bacterium]|jgi:anti-sigma factor (TIGR02949 family)
MSEPQVMACEEALHLLAAHLDRELEPHSHDAVERHLAVCRTCFSRADFERRLKARLGELGREAVDRSFEDRIRGLIQQFTLPGPRPGP